MFLLGLAQAAAADLPLSPPGATWFDALFGIGSLALLIGLVVWQESQASDPPPQL